MKQKGTIIFAILFTSVMVFAVTVAARTSAIEDSTPTPATAAFYPSGTTNQA